MAEQNDKPEKAEADKPPKGGKPVLTPEQEDGSRRPRGCTRGRQGEKQARARAGQRRRQGWSLPPSVSSESQRHACANFSESETAARA